MPIITDGKDRRIGENALSTILMLIKDKFTGYVQKQFKTGSTSEYKTLTDNNLTDSLKSNYDAAYTHSQMDHAPANAQENIIETVKVNGTALNIENKAVDVPVPLLSTDLSADKTSVAKAATPKAVYDYVTSAINSVGLSFSILSEGQYNADTGVPTVEGSNKYIYLVPDEDSTNDVYNEYIYVNGAFECIGKTAVDLSGYMKKEDLTEFTTEEVQAIWTSVFSS